MIVVATEDFELYHDLVGELRGRGLEFTTVELGDPLPDRTTLVVTAADETIPVPDGTTVLHAKPEAARSTVERAIATLRGEEGRTIVGIDPGERPGVAVLEGETVVASFHVPAGEVGPVVEREVDDAPDPVVRIGDGARLIGARIVDDLPDVPVELVDETGTTPYLGTGARGMGDVLAAVNIARREGERIEERDVEPTAGELTRIKERSRRESTENRTITEGLARRVATGELSIREALDIHGEEDGDARCEPGFDRADPSTDGEE